MGKLSLCAIVLFALCACADDESAEDAEREQRAAEFLHGIYGGDVSVVDRLAAPDIVVSYPIFEEIFSTPAIQGRSAVKKFATGFSHRWIEPTITIHQAVVDGDSVVLLWGFRARRGGADDSEEEPAEAQSAWGGLTLYRFDANGRIVLELGEESTPGPAARVSAAFVKAD